MQKCYGKGKKMVQPPACMLHLLALKLAPNELFEENVAIAWLSASRNDPDTLLLLRPVGAKWRSSANEKDAELTCLTHFAYT